METIARLLHSWTRWIVLVVAIVAIIYFILGLIQKKPWDKRANMLLNAFGGAITVQWLFGLLLLIAYGTFDQRHIWEHLTVQTISMLVANAHHGWRRRQLADSARWQRGLIVMVVSLALIVVGVLLLPVSIQWRFYTP